MFTFVKYFKNFMTAIKSDFSIQTLTTEAISLLKKLIQIPSFSKEEYKTADLIETYLTSKGVKIFRKLNNVWAFSERFDSQLPTILLNSHHDTVKPNKSYTLDPFTPTESEGKLYGLGSNDAGGALVSLIATFLYYNQIAVKPYNLIIAATAEEEISGNNGVELVLPEFGKVDLAIVGEPTQMQLAVAEKGLMVVDCTVRGRAGHAARNEGENAIYKALKDIDWFRSYKFPKVSEMLGEVKMTVTIINAGSQHNVVPDICTFTVDIRPTDIYKNAEILATIRENVSCEVKERSIRLNASSIPISHPIVQQGLRLGRTHYCSPTTSDQALMPFDSIKIGPGDSARSHTADEYIYLEEIKEGIALYIKLLNDLHL
jgi:acetylornithine deacetylase